MGKLCERPGCSDIAAMAYGFDVDRLLVWLAPRDPDADPARAGSLCKRHADAMVVPRGWTLDDRRVDQQRLFRPRPEEIAAATESPAPPRRARRSRAKQPASEVLEVVVAESAADASPVVVELAVAAEVVEELEARTVAGVTGEPSADIDPDATQAIPWLPTLDAEDDLGGVLAADSPLLAGAFRGTDRKR